MLWGLKPVDAQAAYGIAVDRLKRQIHAGLLLPREKLPAERQLSDDFGISRVTLREALRVLEGDRYIVVRRGAHGGAFVTDEERLTEIANRRITRQPAGAMRVLEFLCANELAACGHAVERRGLPELKRMRHAVVLMRQATTQPLLKQAETYFHLALGDASHNPMFARAVEDALADLFLPYGTEPFVQMQAAMIDAHQTLLAAIEAAEAAAALEALRVVHDGYWHRVRRLTARAA